ncbi:MAG: hypothetical protein J1F43_02940 [Muribaculaceae bacterium]|nr:hypothetical protein [Muribaculaceae bacterium]
MYKIFNKIFICILIGVVFMAQFSCRDDFGFDNGIFVPEGEHATISVKISARDMKVFTRDAGIDPDGEEASEIQDLWIGVFSKNTGKKTGQVYLNKSEIIKDHSTREVSLDVNVLSGESYIVGAANTGGLRGLDTENGKRLEEIKNLLLETDNWEEFKRLGGIMNNPLSTQRMGNIFMSGNYSENGDAGSRTLDANNNPNTVAIRPGQNELPGIIHLERVVAYNKFVLIPHEAIKFTPVSWQVVNVPGMSFIHNRENGDLNASDNKMNDGVIFWTGQDDYGKDLNTSFYHTSVESKDFDNVFEIEKYKENYLIDSSFDFYLLENKHTGIITSDQLDNKKITNLYDARELEHKQENGRNTGWYASLVDKTGEIPGGPTSNRELRNNNASYVVLKAVLDYYYDINDEKQTPVIVPEGADIDSRFIRRYVEATYTIHLGYCEGEGLKKANDFNCRRNTSYTYKVLIGGANNIRLEVQNDTEVQPGMEGIVTDLITNLIELDAHYGVFNIALTDRQRKNLKWRIVAPFENDEIDMMHGNKNNKFSLNSGMYIIDDNEAMKQALPQNQFYNWVQIRPTTGKEVLAHYPGDPRLIGRTDIEGYPVKEKTGAGSDDGTIYNYAQSADDKGVWLLETLRDASKFAHPDSHNNLDSESIEKYKTFLGTEFPSPFVEEDEFDKLDEDIKKALNTPHYYTVFIDEYVYEYEKDRNSASLTGRFMQVNQNSEGWRTYVNQDSRKLWLTLNDLEIAQDFESVYSNSVYLISQRSIQTYYNSSAKQAIGVEHINETFINAPIVHYPKNGTNVYESGDGLLNLYRYVTQDWRKSWYRIWNNEKGELAPGDDPENYDEWCQQPAYGYDPNNIGEEMIRYVPKTINQEVLMAMVRNRDLNNNNIIEPYEIRWFIPSAQTYTRIALGSASLTTPLLSPKNFPQNEIQAGKGTLTSHYITGDAKMFWAEEVASVSKWDYGAEEDRSGNLRCIRNLGQELHLVPGSDEYNAAIVTPAYTHDPDNRIIHMEFYRSAALRNEVTTKPIPLHAVGYMESLPTRKFMYYEQEFPLEDGNPFVVPANNNQMRDYSKWWEMVETLPAELGLPDWRVPNINELTILLYSEVLDPDRRYFSCSYEYFNNRNRQGNYAPENHWVLGVAGGQVTADPTANDDSIPYVVLVKDIE